MRTCGVNKCKKESTHKIKMPLKLDDLQICFYVCEEHSEKISVKDRSLAVWEMVTPQQEINTITAERDALKVELAVKDRALELFFHYGIYNGEKCPENVKCQMDDTDNPLVCQKCWLGFCINQAKESTDAKV